VSDLLLHISMNVDIPNEVDRRNSRAPEKNSPESNSNESAGNQDDEDDDMYVYCYCY
jgi:hypothetical protein